MKHFEPIVIQEETENYKGALIEPIKPNDYDVIAVIVGRSRESISRLGITYQAAIRLRDALNTILND